MHDVRLVNFIVDIREVKDKVPDVIKIRDFNGRAIISMVDVKLKKMHPAFLPSCCNFNYRHIAFRLLVEDSDYNNGVNKGIYFFRSFTDKSVIVAGGNLLTDYNLESAVIKEYDNTVELSAGEDRMVYTIEDKPSQRRDNPEYLKATIGALDRAYSTLGNEVRVTQIQREKWPIQFADCSKFETTFFKTARLEGAFKVFETIYYNWLPPKSLIK